MGQQGVKQYRIASFYFVSLFVVTVGDNDEWESRMPHEMESANEVPAISNSSCGVSLAVAFREISSTPKDL